MNFYRRCLVILTAMILSASAVAAQATAETPLGLPSLASEVPGARVGWSDDAKAALLAAKEDHKPVVMIVAPEDCIHCIVLTAKAFRCPAFNALAGQAHFLIQPSLDDPFVKALGITEPGAISLISVGDSSIDERWRLEDVADEPELLAKLAGQSIRPPGPNPLGGNPAGIAPGDPKDCRIKVQPGIAPEEAGFPVLAPRGPVGPRTPPVQPPQPGKIEADLLLVLLGAAAYGLVLFVRRRVKA